jgi:hypothetical protein
MFNVCIRVLVFLCVSGSVSWASDHIDGAATIEDGQADLTDLYAFKTPNKTDSLTVILNMYPGVSPEGHFSSKVSYDLFIRSAEVNKAPLKPGFKTYVMDELNLNCKFKDPRHHTRVGNTDSAGVACVLNKEGAKISSVSGHVGEILENDMVKLMAGPRADSFFISADTFLDVTNRKKFKSQTPGSGSNAMATINVMSIALELNLKSIGLQSEMLALSAQSYTDSDGVDVALDRVGRPEITNLSLHDFSGDNPLKREYNKLTPFENPSLMNPKFKQRLVENISAYDALDASPSWTKDVLDILTDVLMDDFLVINLDSNCLDFGNQFFNIEKELLMGLDVKSCGGRKLTDDIMATLYALYMDGYQADLLNFESGVTFPYQGDSAKSLKSAFPYLDQADDTTWKQWFLFEAAKMMQE